MRHKWIKQPDEDAAGIKCKIWLCKVCSCKKILGIYKFAEPDYARNGQVYTRYIECIDYEKENLKTID